MLVRGLSSPAEVGRDHDDLGGGSPLGGIDAQQQFHEILRGCESALDDEHRGSAHAVMIIGLELPVGEMLYLKPPEPDLVFIVDVQLLET